MINLGLPDHSNRNYINYRIQVWYDDMSVQDIPSRELTGLKIPLEGHENAKSLLLTNDYEDVIESNGINIYCKPVVKFLLSL